MLHKGTELAEVDGLPLAQFPSALHHPLIEDGLVLAHLLLRETVTIEFWF